MKRIILLSAMTALLFSCKKDHDKEGYYSGQQVQVHDGAAWTWIRTDKDGAPVQLGLTINEAALNSVPEGEEGDGDHNHHENNYFVPLPAKASETTPFKTLMLNWNPSGHEPDDVYTIPHFDIHFYMVSEQEIMNTTNEEKMNNLPDAQYLPATYISPMPGIPMMGRHWIDVTSPELNGETFTETFLYGSYDGKVTFMEPMITLDFLKQTSNYQRNIPQPTKYKTAGYYPTKMRVVKQNGGTNIILDGFVFRQAS